MKKEKKDSSLEELKQKYLLAKEKSAEKRLLYALIKRKDPSFTGKV